MVLHIKSKVIKALDSFIINLVATHKTLSFSWDNASGCIDMMPFLPRSLRIRKKYYKWILFSKNCIKFSIQEYM